MGLGKETEVYQPEKNTPSEPRTCTDLGAGGSWHAYGEAWLMAGGGALDFPGGPVVKNLPASAGHTGSIPGLGSFHMPRSN